MPALRKERGSQQDSGESESRPRSGEPRSGSARSLDPALVVLLEALVSDDDETVAGALRTVGVRLLSASRRPLLAATLADLPLELRRHDPTLLALEAMLCRLDARYEDAIRLSSAAQALLDERGLDGVAPDTVDWIALLMLWRSRCGWADPHEAVARVRSRLGCGHGLSNSHALGAGASSEWSSWLMGELASVQILTGDLDEAALHLDEMIENSRRLGNDRMLAAGLGHRSLLELVDGAYQTAAATARSSLELTDGEGSASLPHVACAHLVLGWAALEELELDTAGEQLLVALAEPPVALDPLLTQLARLLRVSLLSKRGLLQNAHQLLAEHQVEPHPQPAFLHRLSLVTSAQLAAVANDTSAIRDHATALAELGCLEEAELFDAVAEAGDGRLNSALTGLDALLSRPRLPHPVGAGAAALRVGLLLRSGRNTKAAELLPDLLSRVESQRMLLALTAALLGGTAFTRLLEGEASRPDGHPFAAEALAGLSDFVRPVPDRGAPTAADRESARSLTPRERDVLAELALGGSYADVAAALFLSENTVKTHLTSIYRKLGVDRRGEALRVARENHSM